MGFGIFRFRVVLRILNRGQQGENEEMVGLGIWDVIAVFDVFLAILVSAQMRFLFISALAITAWNRKLLSSFELEVCLNVA